MVEGHRANSIVVCLKDSFKVEGEAVPEGEFSRCGSGEDTSGFGCPLVGQLQCMVEGNVRAVLTMTTWIAVLILFVDVCTNFVQREVEGFSGYALGNKT